MTKQLFISLTFLVFIVFGCKKDNLVSSQTLKTNNPLTTSLEKKVNDIIAPHAQKSTTASVSIGIFKDNKTSYFGYGETEKGNNIIPDSTTIYEIGSISKTFTSLLMMDYLQKNGLSVDCPVNSLLPANIPLLQYNNKPILIKHLLNHTSGLPRMPDNFETGSNPNNPYKHYDSTMIYEYLKTHPLQREPGKTWEYSNLATALVGIILERQTHRSYEQLLLEKISIPLGLNQTKITLDKKDSLNLATGYDANGKQMSYWDDFNAFKGAGAIRSNAKDLIAYGKTFLNAETSVLKPQIDSCLQITFNNNSRKQASGWSYEAYNGADFIIHDGGTAGFNCYIIICKDKKTIIVLLLSNGPSDSHVNYLNQMVIEFLK